MPLDIMGSIAAGYNIGKDIRQRRDAGALRKEMQGLFEDFNGYTKFDATEGLPNAAAPASTAALPVNEAPESVNVAAQSMGVGTAPTALPTAAPVAPARAPRQQASYEDLNRINARIAKVAALSGNPEALNALQSTFANQVRNRALNNLAEAQTAYSAGNVDEAERALVNMSRLFPATSGLKFTRKDGQLVFKNPLKDGAIDTVNPETMGLMFKMLSSPEVVYDLIGQKRTEKAAADNKNRELTVAEQNAASNAQNADTQAANAAETARRNKANEPSEIRARDAAALRDLSYSRYQDAQAAAAGDGSGGIKPNEARQFASDVRTVVENTMFPQTQVQDPATGSWVKAPATPLPGYENATAEDLNRVSSFAEQIGIANPSTGLSTAGQAALEIDRTMRNGGTLRVNQRTGQIGIPQANGQLLVFNASPQLVQMLQAAQKPAPSREPPALLRRPGWEAPAQQGLPTPMRPQAPAPAPAPAPAAPPQGAIPTGPPPGIPDAVWQNALRQNGGNARLAYEMLNQYNALPN